MSLSSSKLKSLTHYSYAHPEGSNLMKNSEIAGVFQDITDLLELKGENPSKIMMEPKHA